MRDNFLGILISMYITFSIIIIKCQKTRWDSDWSCTCQFCLIIHFRAKASCRMNFFLLTAQILWNYNVKKQKFKFEFKKIKINKNCRKLNIRYLYRINSIEIDLQMQCTACLHYIAIASKICMKCQLKLNYCFQWM